MSKILEVIGARPLKYLRLLLTLFILALVGLFLYYYSSVSTRYIVNLYFDVRRAEKLNLKSCKSNPTSECVDALLKEHHMTNNAITAMTLVKAVGVFMSVKNKENAEKITLEMNKEMNNVFSAFDLKNNYLLKQKPYFESAKLELCMLKTVEKETTIMFLDKLQSQSSKDRQKTYETYPNNQEMIHVFVKRQEILDKMRVDVETYFPAQTLAKCSEALKQTESQSQREEAHKLKKQPKE